MQNNQRNLVRYPAWTNSAKATGRHAPLGKTKLPA